MNIWTSGLTAVLMSAFIVVTPVLILRSGLRDYEEVSECLFCALLFLGFWDKGFGILGALGSCVTFVATVTIIPFRPNGWAASAGGFPAMVGNVAFLMKDLVLFSASVYLLKQDVMRVLATAKPREIAASHQS